MAEGLNMAQVQAAMKAMTAPIAASRNKAPSACPITSIDNNAPEARMVGIDISIEIRAASSRA